MQRNASCWTGVAATALMGASVALADDQPALASVTIINVASDVARNIGVDASQIPLNVQVPVEVAVAVCGIPAEELTKKAASGVAQCTARSTTSGLDRAVERQVRGNAK